MPLGRRRKLRSRGLCYGGWVEFGHVWPCAPALGSGRVSHGCFVHVASPKKSSALSYGTLNRLRLRTNRHASSIPIHFTPVQRLRPPEMGHSTAARLIRIPGTIHTAANILNSSYRNKRKAVINIISVKTVTQT